MIDRIRRFVTYNRSRFYNWIDQLRPPFLMGRLDKRKFNFANESNPAISFNRDRYTKMKHSELLSGVIHTANYD